MNNVTKQVVGVVAAVALFAVLASAGYLASIGSGQSFGPDNEPRSNVKVKNPAPGNNVSNPIPEGESVWEDYDESSFKQKERLAVRPGNMLILKKVGELFEAIYQVEPSYPDMAFPFNDNGSRIESAGVYTEDAVEWEKKQREDGKKERNKFRSYNWVIHKLTLLDFDEGEGAIANPADYGVGDGNAERFASVRKDHAERCCLVLIRASLESLRSDKIEGNESDSDFILCFVMKKDGWKLVWFEK